MNTKLKCPNCGAEITNLSFGNGKWRWLSVLFILLPLIVLFGPLRSALWWSKADYTKELVVTLVDTRFSKDKIDVLGKVGNASKHDWQMVEVLAELYSKDGRYLAQGALSLPGSIQPGAERQFRLVLYLPGDEPTAGSPKVVLKVVGAFHMPF